MKNNLLSIGEISKITNTSIKSLRYYDQIGVLKPAYVDPSNSYRYYTYQQIGIVDAIRACINLGIPLKEFSKYTESNGNIIHYAQLIEHGKRLAEEKVKRLQEDIYMIELFQREIERCNALRNQDTPVIIDMPVTKYYILPLDNIVDERNYHEGFQTIYNNAMLEGYKLGYERGKLFFYENKIIQRYSFVCIIESPREKYNNKNILSLPARLYESKFVISSRIENANEEFPRLFSKNYKKILIETEVPFKNYDITKPFLKLSCSLPYEETI